MSKVIKRMVREEEVEPPPDLITQAEACKTYGLDRRRLSEAVGVHIPGYIAPDRKVKRGLPGPLVSRADIEKWIRPIFDEGQEEDIEMRTYQRLLAWVHSDAQPPAWNEVSGIITAGNGLRFSETDDGKIWLENEVNGGREVSLAEAKHLIEEQ